MTRIATQHPAPLFEATFAQLETVTVTIIYPVNPAQPHPLDGKARTFEVNESTLAAAISYYTEVPW